MGNRERLEKKAKYDSERRPEITRNIYIVSERTRNGLEFFEKVKAENFFEKLSVL